MQTTPVPFWLMMVSTASAVLPVWRSPIMSSRWPRPIGTIESMDFRPVCTGCDTDWRAITPGAIFSIELLAHRHFHDAPGAFDRVALGDVLVLAHDHRAHRVALEVERQPISVSGELDHLALHHVGQAVHAADAVGESDHGPFGAGLGPGLEFFDARFDQAADFGWIQLHGCIPKVSK